MLDGLGTTGISPPKSNWAQPIDSPPYVAYVTTTGITFTFGGLKINEATEVQDLTDRSIPGLYAAGRTSAGLPGAPYIASGLSVGDCTFFGRRAGRAAAQEGAPV